MTIIWFLLLCVHIKQTAACCKSYCKIPRLLLGGKYKNIDLTFPFDDRSMYFKETESQKDDIPESPVVAMLGGSYLEAPSAYYKEGATIADIPAKDSIIQLIVIDVSPKVKDNSKYVLRMSDVDDSIDPEAVKFLLMWPSLLVIKFGWCRYYHDDKYLGHDKDNNEYSFPVISHEVAKWITTNETCRNVIGLGVDLPNIERKSCKGFPVHKTLAKAGLYVIQNLNLTSDLSTHECTVGAFALKEAKSRNLASVAAVCPIAPNTECYSDTDTKTKEKEHETEKYVKKEYENQGNNNNKPNKNENKENSGATSMKPTPGIIQAIIEHFKQKLESMFHFDEIHYNSNDESNDTDTATL